MTVTAKLRYLRIAPRKVRLVADLIRGKNTEEAQTILNFTTKGASLPLTKLLNQAVANAKNNFQLDPSNLYISKITVEEGPKYKRWEARSRGQAYEIQKKTSHITIVLGELKKKAKKIKKAKEEPVVAEKPKNAEEEEIVRWEKSKPKPRPEAEIKKPTGDKSLKRVFRRKAF